MEDTDGTSCVPHPAGSVWRALPKSGDVLTLWNEAGAVNSNHSGTLGEGETLVVLAEETSRHHFHQKESDAKVLARGRVFWIAHVAWKNYRGRAMYLDRVDGGEP